MNSELPLDFLADLRCRTELSFLLGLIVIANDFNR